jgi:hypothetical protein
MSLLNRRQQFTQVTQIFCPLSLVPDPFHRQLMAQRLPYPFPSVNLRNLSNLRILNRIC